MIEQVPGRAQTFRFQSAHYRNVCDWCHDQMGLNGRLNSLYWFGYGDQLGWHHVSFAWNSDAMLFKLRWC